MTTRDDIKEQVQQATDIVRLVGEQVALRPKGHEFVGLCPFHDDRNPSMQVSPVKQIYKCFSCGAGGDVFSFTMNYHKMAFPEAMEYLAQRAGIAIEKREGGSGASSTAGERKRIAQANQQALDFYRTMLKHPTRGEVGRQTIDRRGISPEMVAAFQLGYAPDGWDHLVRTIEQKGWDPKAFELASLTRPRKSASGCFDFLRHRLVFPIFDALGRPIAFGGRKLREEDEPKYLNTPETKLFHKSRTLYGLHLAKKPIIDGTTAVIVEGYTDVIACHQAGMTNVVATLGTALTAEHVAELRRYAEKVVLIFDADEAGEKAADRAVELFLAGEVDVAIAVLPKGPGGGKMDPAELLALQDGPQRWREAIEAAQDALAYQFERVRRRLDAARTVTGRQKTVEDYLAKLAQSGLTRMGAVRRAMVVQRLASLVRLSEGRIDELLRRAVPARHDQVRSNATARESAGRVAPPGTARQSGVEIPALDGENNPLRREQETAAAFGAARRPPRGIAMAERQIIASLLRDNTLFDKPLADGRAVDEAIAPADFEGQAMRRLYERVHERLAHEGGVSLTGLLGDLASEGEQDLANLATQADAEVEGASQGRPGQLAEVFTAAAEAVRAHRREIEYQHTRQTLKHKDANQAPQLRRLMEQRRSNPSPVRIAGSRR